MRAVVVLSFVLAAASIARGQSAPDTPDADAMVASARQIYTQQGPKAALPEFEKALAHFRSVNDRKHEAITLGFMGNCYRREGDFSRALQFVQQAMEIKEALGDELEVGRSHNQFGLIYWEMAKYPEAIEHLQQAIAVAAAFNNAELEGQARNNLGLVYDELGDYRNSRAQYDKALQLHRSNHFERGEADTLANIGGIDLLLGHYREALAEYKEALSIHQRLGLAPTASIDLGNAAICYSALGDTASALQSFDTAIGLAKKAGLLKEEADWHKGKATALLRDGKFDASLDEYHDAQASYEAAKLTRELVEALNETGTVDLMLGDSASAEHAFRRSLELAQGIDNARGVTLTLMALGDLEAHLRRYAPAAEDYMQALARARSSGDVATQVNALVQLAFAHRETKELQLAASEANEALRVAVASDVVPAESQAHFAVAEVERATNQPEAALKEYGLAAQLSKTSDDPDVAWRVAAGRAHALQALHRPEEAVKAYRDAIEIIENVRSSIREERYRAGYLDDKYHVYVALIALLLDMNRLGDAFRVSEQLRSRAFIEGTATGNAGLSEAERQNESELRARIDELRRATRHEWERPEKERRRDALSLFSAELDTAERAYQQLLDETQAKTRASRSEAGTPTVSDVRENLPQDTGLIEYVVSPAELAILLVTRERVDAARVPITSENLESRVELLRSLVAQPDSNEWRTPAMALREVLIAPLERKQLLQGLRRLYLVPNGVLNYLPFAALERSVNGQARFLAEEFELAYLPSALLLQQETHDSTAAHKLLAIAPQRAHLRYAEMEAKDVAELFQPDSRLLAGKDATKNAFKRLAGDYEVLHLATHGYWNRHTPMLSGLELEPADSDDGILEVHEILEMKLHSQLVTLSACDTALGSGYFSEIPAGDEFVGLTRAFLSAGSRAVLASLWKVDDRSTLEFMLDFYGRLPAGSKAAALAAAQKKMRAAGGRYRHPYYWAPFVLVGRMD